MDWMAALCAGEIDLSSCSEEDIAVIDNACDRDRAPAPAPAQPEVALCPNGTTFSPDATTPEIGECRHACHAPDAWDPEHVCYSMVSTGTFDYSNNTCGIGDCDSHTTRSACEGGEGHWEIDQMVSEQLCSSVQATTSRLTYAMPVFGYAIAMRAVSKVGETCCDGFDAEAFRASMQCTSDDAPIFVRPKMHHVLTNAPHVFTALRPAAAS